MFRRIPWLALLEGLLFLLPAVFGVGIVGVLQSAPDPRVGRTMVLLASTGGLVIRLGVPVCLFFDARAVRERGDWRPNRAAYVLGALLVSAPLAALVYLHRRHRNVRIEEHEGRWWLVVGAAFVGALAGIPVALVGLAFAMPGPAVALPATIGVLALGLLPPAIYRDAVYLRNQRPAGWRPNPALYLGLALAGVTLPVLQLLVAGYYLYRRQLHPIRSRFSRITDKGVAEAGAGTKPYPGVFRGAMAQFSDDDEGKSVVNADGEEVGIITTVEHGTAHVDPNPGITDKIMSTLGWSDQDEDTYPLQEESVEAITDDEVRLASTTGTGTGTGAGTSTGAGSGAGTANVGDDSGVGSDDDGIIGDDDDSTLGNDDDGVIRDDDDDGVIRDNDDSTIGSNDDTVGSNDDDGLIGDDDDTVGSDNDDDLIGDDDDDDLLGDDDSDRNTGR